MKPIFQPDKNDSFEDGVQAISDHLMQSGLFDTEDRPMIKLVVGHDGTLFVKSVVADSEEQEKYIRQFLESTNEQWSSARHVHWRFDDDELVPVNFGFVLKITFS